MCFVDFFQAKHHQLSGLQPKAEKLTPFPSGNLCRFFDFEYLARRLWRQQLLLQAVQDFLSAGNCFRPRFVPAIERRAVVNDLDALSRTTSSSRPSRH